MDGHAYGPVSRALTANETNNSKCEYGITWVVECIGAMGACVAHMSCVLDGQIARGEFGIVNFKQGNDVSQFD